jgi:glycosyltransferase involved in cell wall biosynthesis
MPRLLIVCEYPTLLGGERSMLATIPAVVAGGFDVAVAAPSVGALAATLRDRKIKHVGWQTDATCGERPPIGQLRAELAKIVGSHRPDLLHANSLSAARIAGPVAAECGVPSIGHLRDILKLSRQAIDDLNQHHRLLAVSRAARDFHVTQGVDETNCVVVHNGVDLAEFRPRPPSGYLHRELALPRAAKFVAVIGQLGLRKGTDVALAAASQIANCVPDGHWLIVGERTSNKAEAHDFETRLRSLAAEPPLAGRVHFLGARSDVADLLCECVLLVHAARQEPLGRVLLEAAACGLAVVATDVGGTREIFPTEADGAMLVRPDSAQELAAVASLLLQENVRRRVQSAAARHRAAAAFDVRIAAAKLIEQYHDVLSCAFPCRSKRRRDFQTDAAT